MTATRAYYRLDGAATVPLSEHRRCLTERSNYADGMYVGPGLFIPPAKEQCACACSERDRYGRPVVIGLCGESCERRPR